MDTVRWSGKRPTPGGVRELIAPETVDEVFRQSTLDLVEAARVDNFVPLLAERRTRERLIALAQG